MLDLYLLLPEISVTIISLIGILVGVFVKKSARIFSLIAALSLFFIAYLISEYKNRLIGDGINIRINEFNLYIKTLILILSSLNILIYIGYNKIKFQEISIEYVILLMLSVIGMMVSISTNNFLLLYIAIELQSLVAYILAAYKRDGKFSSEAALKYFILGSMASAFILFGISYIYGFTADINFLAFNNIEDYSRIMFNNELPFVFYLASFMVVIGICFKLSAAPFHFWAPDVYQGAPLFSMVFFSTVSKLVIFVVLINLLFKAFSFQIDLLQNLILFFSISSMFIGALGGIKQHSIKRLIGYSAINNIGYILLGLAIGTDESINASFVFILIYSFTILGLVATFMLISDKSYEDFTLDSLSGLARTKKTASVIISIFLFSLIGIPPFAGFFGKFYLITTALKSQYLLSTFCIIISSVIAAYYYLIIIKSMYFISPKSTFPHTILNSELVFVISLSLIFISFIFLNPDILFNQMEIINKLR